MAGAHFSPCTPEEQQKQPRQAHSAVFTSRAQIWRLIPVSLMLWNVTEGLMEDFNPWLASGLSVSCCAAADRGQLTGGRSAAVSSGERGDTTAESRGMSAPTHRHLSPVNRLKEQTLPVCTFSLSHPVDVLGHLDLIELWCKGSWERDAAESFELKTVCLSAAA